MVSDIGWNLRTVVLKALLVLGLIGFFVGSTSAAGPSPQLEWVRCYNGPSNDQDEGKVVAVDSGGNIVVAGDTYQRFDTNPDIATVKYDGNGNRLWSRVWSSGGTRRDHVSSIAIDAAGSVYVAGNTYYYGFTNPDWVIVKYDRDGNEQWVRTYAGDGGDYDLISDIALDRDGNLVVTGGSYTSSTISQFQTIKYSPSGNVMWARSYSSEAGMTAWATALDVDASGNIAVTGSVNTATFSDYLTVKYSSDGTVLWDRRYNGLSNGFDAGVDVAFDGESNVIVTGVVMEEDYQTDFGTFKYAPNGTLLWQRRYNSVMSSIDEAAQLKVDSVGNVFVAGQCYNPGRDQWGYAVAKYDPHGLPLWNRSVPGGSENREIPCAMVVDRNGNVVLTTTVEQPSTYRDSSTMMFGQQGKLLWTLEYHADEAPNTEMTVALAVDLEGHVYLTGTGWSDGSSFDFITMKLHNPGPTHLGLRSSDGYVGMKATFTAVLRDRESLQPLSGMPVRFLFDNVTFASDALTNEKGIVRLEYTIPEGTTVGTHSLKARFDGGEGCSVSIRTVPIEVYKGPSTLRVYSKSAAAGQTLILGARLTNGSGTALAGRGLRIVLAGKVLGSCTTNSLGVGGIKYIVPEGTVSGNYELRFEFEGDETHEPSNGTGTLTVG